ncbi:hypothetical protein PSHT_09567, partial [Puccinia striiformis]
PMRLIAVCDLSRTPVGWPGVGFSTCKLDIKEAFHIYHDASISFVRRRHGATTRGTYLAKRTSLEGLASMVIVWFFGVLLSTLSAMSSKQSSFYGSAYLSISVAIFVTMLIRINRLTSSNRFCLQRGPLTGGHLSPIVSISFCIAGITPPIQAICYLFAQISGATVAGFLLALSLGPRAVDIENYGCYFNPSPQFNSPVCIVEFMGAICVIAMMYGESVLLFHIILVFRILTLSEGFNTSPGPQDQNPFHSITTLIEWHLSGVGRMSPLLIIYNQANLPIFNPSDYFAPANSYGGATGFPTRCWASSAAIFKFEPNDWVFWLPAMAAAALHGLAYRFLNPCVDESVNSSLADLTTNYTLNSSSAGLPMSDVIIHMNASESCEIKDKR